MLLFSQRKGILPLQKEVQRESMDSELRNRLWSALQIAVWQKYSGPYVYGYQDPASKQIEALFDLLWLNHFKQPLDTAPPYQTTGHEALRGHFFQANWWQVYDFVEFVMNNIPAELHGLLRTLVNRFLEEENASYRIVDTEIVEITDDQEIGTIESALDHGLFSVRQHLSRSLDLLSDRKKPDYRNSIKEAISAVEAACQTISGKAQATLPDCLKALKRRKTLHPAFQRAMIKQYSYARDERGIRHALSEAAEAPTFADAKFMLVSCSAFINYLWTKAAELGMNLKRGEGFRWRRHEVNGCRSDRPRAVSHERGAASQGWQRQRSQDEATKDSAS